MGVISLLTGADPIIPWLRSSESRKQKAELWLRYYRDRQADDLLQLIRATWRDPESFRIFQVNVVKKIVDKLAMVYKAAPVRTFEGVAPELVEDVYGQLRANVWLKRRRTRSRSCSRPRCCRCRGRARGRGSRL